MPKRNTYRTQRRTYRVNQELERVHQAARRDRDTQFTALLHHINVDRLRQSFLDLEKQAAPGIDGVTWREYEKDLEERLRDLHGRIHRGGYRARAVRRTHIPKGDGRQRALGIASIEDKVVQASLVAVLDAIYEADFLGFSYGFRPGRGTHDALDAVTVAIQRAKVNWVLDADIRGFFDAIDHECLMRFVEHRIGDKRVLRLIRKWLNAGVMEAGRWTALEKGTPQGATISPLLGNLYLHHALDLWADRWRHRAARGEVVIVRYADDFIVGFQYRDDAERFQEELEQRLRTFHLEVHPDKTRLIEFGRFAAENRRKRGDGKPKTFDFLGFTHICGKSRRGRFQVRRKTSRKKLANKLKEVKTELMRRRHASVPDQGRWLRTVVRGHFNYFAVPTNYPALAVFLREVKELWIRALRRRSQRHRMTWPRLERYARRWLPTPRILHPWP